MRLCIVTRGYPSRDKIYNHGFVHRRVLAYKAMGIDVTVFCLRHRAEPFIYEYDGVEVTVGSSEFCLHEVNKLNPDAVAVHAPGDEFRTLLQGLRNRRVVAWIYGSEMMPFYKVTERENDDPVRRQKAEATFNRRIAFWREFLQDPGPNFTFAFVSEYAWRIAEESVGFPIHQAVVLPSPVDTDLFSYQPKPAGQRFDILSIRPFSDWRYANDMSVQAVLLLRQHPAFKAMRFRFVGEGRLFNQTLAPIRDFHNVICEERTMSQEEIATAHHKAGIFLCPTRDDAQGVTRDEAMSSGMVIATNAVGPIPEFANDDCAILAGAEDAAGLAQGIANLIEAPTLFQAKSEAAAARIRNTLAITEIMPQELVLLGLQARDAKSQ